MKLNWILYIAISSFLFAPLFSFAEEELTESAQNKKPDQDEVDPLKGAEVTIRKEENRLIEEYRVNGRLLQVKITPKYGYPYYLIDTDADGTFDVRSSEAWRNTTVNTWKIFQW
ncbi:MAG: DUF2782 domain-containing protein [Pseudomonadota bacterium]